MRERGRPQRENSSTFLFLLLSLFFFPGWKSTINQSHLRYKQLGKADRSWREKEQKREGENLLSVKPCLVNSRLEGDGTEKKNLFLSNFLVLPLFTSSFLAPSEFPVSKSEMFSSVGPPESREREAVANCPRLIILSRTQLKSAANWHQGGKDEKCFSLSLPHHPYFHTDPWTAWGD